MTPHQQHNLQSRGWKENIPFSVLGVSDRVADDVLEEDLQDTTGLLVDQAGDTLDTATTRKTTDSLNTSGRRATCK